MAKEFDKGNGKIAEEKDNFEMEVETVTLIDEEGEEHPFEIIEIIEVEDREYAILAPLDEADLEGLDEDEAVIFRLEVDEETGEELLIEIEEDEEWEAVAEAYMGMEDDEDEE